MGKGSSKGHTPREAKDNLKSTQLLSVIDAISEGPIEGPVDGLKSVLLNSTPVLDSDYIRVTDNKGKTHDVLTGSDDGRHSNTSLAWGAGVQFNPTESVAVDVAYEGSGSGDWRTDGFIVGVGYKF
ncbi:TPA: Ail/Lom family outer membrane beta-barrel protein [Escherichia coli]|nr:Ail/Lom family outer membrane beta-barrel protein [Escherichia coli]